MYESDFYAQYQQVGQSLETQLRQVDIVPRIRYTVVRHVEMRMAVEFGEETSLSPSDIESGTHAFRTASNPEYAATSSDCRPEFRLIEIVNANGATVINVKHRRIEYASELPHGTTEIFDRDLRANKCWKRMTVRLSSPGYMPILFSSEIAPAPSLGVPRDPRRRASIATGG